MGHSFAPAPSSPPADRFVLERLPPRELWPEGVEQDRPSLLNVTHWLQQRARRGGWLQRPALLSAEGSWTYAELFRRADRLAVALVELGRLKPGGRVLMRSHNSPDLLALWLAVAKAGGVAVATMPMLRAKELAEMIKIGGIDLACCETMLLAELEEARQRTGSRVRILKLEEMADGGNEAPCPHRPTTSADPCLIGFTSGTTGRPKATVHSHFNVRATYRTMGRAIGLTADDVVLCPAPIGFTFGLCASLVYPFASGSAVIPFAQPSPAALAQAAQLLSPTMLFASPLLYRRLLDSHDGKAWASLRVAWSGGDMLQKELQQRWAAETKVPLRNLFGTTELFQAVLLSSPDSNALSTAPGYRAAVIDEHGRVRRRGSGLLAIKGPTGCRYLADDRQRAYVQQGWNLTGDRASIGTDGTIQLVGRREDVIVSAGYNISAAEIEEAILAMEDVIECAVIGVPDEQRGQVAAAHVVLKPGSKTDGKAAAIQEHVKAALAPYKYPRVVHFADSLPRGPTGKIQRHLIRTGGG